MFEDLTEFEEVIIGLLKIGTHLCEAELGTDYLTVSRDLDFVGYRTPVMPFIVCPDKEFKLFISANCWPYDESPEFFAKVQDMFKSEVRLYFGNRYTSRFENSEFFVLKSSYNEQDRIIDIDISSVPEDKWEKLCEEKTPTITFMRDIKNG